MPDGHVHAAAARVFTVGAALASLGLAILHPPALGIVVGAFVGEIAGPDLDMPLITQQERRSDFGQPT